MFDNLTCALKAAGCTAANLVKLTVFLRDMCHLDAYREARNRFFSIVTPPAAPAVTLVEMSNLHGPDFLIEIEAMAARCRLRHRLEDHIERRFRRAPHRFKTA